MSQAEHRFASNVRICSTDTSAVGVGFLVGPRHVMTCAHVVADALGDAALASDPSVPHGEVLLDFLVQPGILLRAHVVAWRAQRAVPGSLHEPDDIAVLELAADTPSPQGARAIQVGSGVDADDRVHAFGVAAGNARGIGIVGEVVERVEGRWAFHATNPDAAVQAGCSGAAVWAPMRDGVVGMIVEMQQSLTGLFLPVNMLQAVWPLDQVADAGVNKRARAPLNRALAGKIHICDRQEQAIRFDIALTEQWDRGRLPLLCMIGGVDDDLLKSCQQRCLTGPLRLRLERILIDTHRLDVCRLPWPNRKVFDLQDAILALKNGLKLEFKADDIDATSLRAAHDKWLKPWAFYSDLEAGAFSTQHVALLQQWAEFWRGLGELDRPLIHFVLVKLDDRKWVSTAREPDVALHRIYARTVAEFNAAEVRALPLLRHLSLDDVNDWLGNLADELDLSEGEVADLTFEARKSLRIESPLRLRALSHWATTVSS